MASNHQLPLAVARDPTPDEIKSYLQTRSSAEMAELVQSIGESSAQGALSTAVAFSTPQAPATEAPTQRKALNAFVGYRCYYIYAPEFKPWPMKKLSGVLATMWDTEPNKAIWALLAKAWSLIRDQIGKDRAPLDVFFKIMCPVMSLPSAEAYLDLYGWSLKVKPDGEPYVSRDFIPEALPEVPSNPTMPIGDIIRYCHGLGYALEFELDESMTPTTFHIQIGPRQRSSADIIDEMEKKRVAQRSKRRAQREKSRKAGVPNKIKQRQHTLRKLNRSVPPEPAFMQMPIQDPVQMPTQAPVQMPMQAPVLQMPMQASVQMALQALPAFDEQFFPGDMASPGSSIDALTPPAFASLTTLPQLSDANAINVPVTTTMMQPQLPQASFTTFTDPLPNTSLAQAIASDHGYFPLHDFNGTDSNGTDLNGTDFNGTGFNGTDFNGTDFNGTSFNSANFTGTSTNFAWNDGNATGFVLKQVMQNMDTLAMSQVSTFDSNGTDELAFWDVANEDATLPPSFSPQFSGHF